MAVNVPQYMNVTPRVEGLEKFRADAMQVPAIVKQATAAANKQGTSFQPFKFDASRVNRNINSITKSFGGFWRSFDARQNVLTSFGQQLQGVGRSLRYFAFDFERLGRTLSVALTVPLAAAGVAIVKWGSEFEAQLKKVEVLVNQSEQTVARWGKEILTTMTGLGQSPLELAEGLFFAASAFGSVADKAPVMDVLRNAAAGATIGLGEMDDVTRLLTASVNAYRNEGLTAAEAMFTLISAVTEGSFEADKLAGSLGRVLGSATALKIPFRDLVGYVAGISRLGEEPSRIITSLNSALLKMLSPGAQANKIMEAYGFTIDEVKSSLAEDGGLIDLLNRMRAAMPDEQLGKIFTTRAARTIFAATDALADDFQQIGASMTEAEKERLAEIEEVNKLRAAGATGAWIDAYEEQLDAANFYNDLIQKKVLSTVDTVAGQWKIFKDTMQTIGISTYQTVIQKPLLDWLKELNTRLIDVNRTIAQNPKTVRAILAIGAGLAALGPTIIILARITQSLTVFTGILGAALRLAGTFGGVIINSVVRVFGFMGSAVLNAIRVFVPFLGVLTAMSNAIFLRAVPALGALALRFLTAAASIVQAGLAAAAGAVWFTTSTVASVTLGNAFSFLGTAVTVTTVVLKGFFGVLAIGVAPALAVAGAFAAVGGALAALATMGGKVINILEPIFKGISDGFNQVKEESATWGEELMGEYSNGIIRGAAYVVRALTAIGNVIMGMLKPKSPPPILPEIDKWGTGTMEAWLEGWGKADFSILDNVMGKVQSYLTNVLDFDDDDNKQGIVAGMLLGSQDAIIKAIAEVKKTGLVAKATIDKIFADLGTSTPALRGFVTAQLKVAAATDKMTEAQNRLNEVTLKYEKLLKPLNRRLEQINAQQEERERKSREEALKRLLETEIPDRIRTAAKLELEELSIERQIGALESQQAAETEPLEDQMALAEEELAAAQQQLDYFEGLLGLQERQGSLLEDLKESVDKIKDKIDKLKTGDVFEPGEGMNIEELGLDTEGIGLDLGGSPLGELDMQLESLMEEVEEMGRVWGDVMTELGNKWNTFKTQHVDPVIKSIKDFWTNDLVPTADVVKEGMKEAARVAEEESAKVEDPGLAWDMLGTQDGMTFPEYVKNLFDEAFGPIQQRTMAENAQIMMDNINQTIIPGFYDGKQSVLDFKNTVGNSFLAVLGFSFEMKRGIGVAMDFIKGSFTSAGDSFETWRQNADGKVAEFNENVGTFVEDVKGKLLDFSTSWHGTSTNVGRSATLMGGSLSRFKLTFLIVKRAINNAIEALKKKFEEWWEQLEEIVAWLQDSFKSAMEDVEDWLNDIKTALENASGWVDSLKESLKTLVTDGLEAAEKAFENLHSMLTTVGDYISQTFQGLWDTLGSTIQTVLGWINDAIEAASTLINLRDRLGGGGQPDTNPNNTNTDTPDAPAADAQAESFYQIPDNLGMQPLNTSPWRNISPVSGTGISRSLPQSGSHDESVSVHVAGGLAAFDGGAIVNIGDVYISSEMDMREFELRVERVITNSVSR